MKAATQFSELLSQRERFSRSTTVCIVVKRATITRGAASKLLNRVPNPQRAYSRKLPFFNKRIRLYSG